MPCHCGAPIVVFDDNGEASCSDDPSHDIDGGYLNDDELAEAGRWEITTDAEAEAGCSIAGCDRPHLARGWCRKHYERWWTHGDPLTVKLERGFWERVVETESGCHEWVGDRHELMGYGRLRRDGRRLLAHRYAWELAHGPIPEGMCVLHSCDNPPCCYVPHLFLGTKADNNADKVAKGRNVAPRGEANGHALLTSEQVAEIRRRYAAGGISQKALGLEYGVTQSCIWGVVNERTYVA